MFWGSFPFTVILKAMNDEHEQTGQNPLIFA